MNIKYFDHAATTSVNEDVLKEMIPYFKMNFGNASSMYSIGRKSKKAIEDSREKIAKAKMRMKYILQHVEVKVIT